MRRAVHTFNSKLKSPRGASITFALLLFLVCAVVGSIVLAAGSAASGRLSKLAESDGRYYAVTSAAELLRDSVADHSYVLTMEKQTVLKTQSVFTRPVGGTDWIGPSAEPTPVPDGDPTYSYVLQSGAAASELSSRDGISMLANSSLDLIVGRTVMFDEADPSVPWTAASSAPAAWTEADGTREFTLKLTEVSGVDTDGAKVQVESVLLPNGDLTLTVENTEGAPYTLRLFFRADKRTTNGGSTLPISTTRETQSETQYTVTELEKKIETRTVTVTWKYIGMEKGRVED